MFEVGWDQAAGLRADPARSQARVMPVASPAQPARAYEMLCTLAAHLSALGKHPVIIDGSAPESGEWRNTDGSHLGLLHALNDPSIAGLGQPLDGAEWLVMPGAHGLNALQQTARAAGASVALSRLLAPFSSGTLLLLYAPAPALVALFSGLPARALVPVLAQPQASIDAYASLKLLHAAGLSPVLAPMEVDAAGARTPLQPVLQAVVDCARRHLSHEATLWPLNSWGLRVQEAALGLLDAPPDHRFAAAPGAHAWAASTTWS